MKKALSALIFTFILLASFSYADTTVITTNQHPCCTTEPLSKVQTPYGACPQYNFWGCYKDKDCDCIPDVKDKCPMDKENYNNIDDRDGCPEELIRMIVIDKKSMTRDSDNDGITDDKDACPFTAGSPNNSGCPLTLKKLHYYPTIVSYTPDAKGYFIKIGSFKSFRRAVNILKQVRKHTRSSVCVRRAKINGRTWFRTYVGPFKTYHRAKIALRKLHRRFKWINYSSSRIVKGRNLYR